jgi:hypothetical protein
VAAVVAAMTVPHWFSAQSDAGPTVPDPPAPSHAPDAPGTRTWQSVKCPPAAVDSCAAPAELDHAGLFLSRQDGHRLVWHGEPGASASVVTTVPRSGADRWVLVGGERAGGDSQLTVEIGGAAPVTVPAGRLSLFALRGHRAYVVRVADAGTPRDGEVLRIVEYVSR